MPSVLNELLFDLVRNRMKPFLTGLEAKFNVFAEDAMHGTIIQTAVSMFLFLNQYMVSRKNPVEFTYETARYKTYLFETSVPIEL